MAERGFLWLRGEVGVGGGTLPCLAVPGERCAGVGVPGMPVGGCRGERGRRSTGS